MYTCLSIVFLNWYDLLVTGVNKYAEVNAETEKLWNAFFSDPDHWWDNRAKKVRPCVQVTQTLVLEAIVVVS